MVGIPVSVRRVQRQPAGSCITVEFELSVDLETAANDVMRQYPVPSATLPRDQTSYCFESDADATSIPMVALGKGQTLR